MTYREGIYSLKSLQSVPGRILPQQPRFLLLSSSVDVHFEYDGIIPPGIGCVTCMLSHFSHVQLFVTLWSVAHQTSLSMGFSRQEYWSGLPCPPQVMLHITVQFFKGRYDLMRRRQWQPTRVLLPGKFHGCRNLMGYSPWGPKEL